MYDIPVVDTYEKGTSTDFNRQGQFARSAMTAQTRHLLMSTVGWADFTATFANGSFVLNVSDGFLYTNGEQHITEAPTPINLVNDAPPSPGLKRIVSIVAYALPAQPVGQEQRVFAVQVTPASSNVPATYQDETRSTYTINRQIARVARYLGDISPQPTPPTLTPDLCEIAQVVLGSAGIESVTWNTKTQAPNLAGQRSRLDGVVTFVDGQGQRIDTIDKNLAALGSKIPQNLSDAMIRQLLSTVASLTQATKVKTGDLAFGIDYALDTSQSDNSYIGYAANIDDGIRFPWASSKQAPLTLYTPGDPVTKVVSNLVLPTWTENPSLVVDGMDGSLSISNQVNTTLTATQVAISRSSVRYGPAFDVCTNSQFFHSGNLDTTSNIFTENGETFQFTPEYNAAGLFDWHYTAQQIFVDSWTQTYWDYVSTSVGLNGAIRAQTFRVPDYGYLTSIDLPFVTADPSYGVTLLLCETNTDGTPNLNRVYERCDLAAGSITANANGAVRTKFNFRPAYLQPGTLYAWVTVTRGNYSLATVANNKYAQGTSFITTDGGAFFAGDTTVDFAFTANFARFASPRAEIRFNDIDNTNGDVISALKLLYGSIIPQGTQIIHQAKRSGGDWTTVATVDPNNPLTTPLDTGPFGSLPLPASVQHKIVLVGSTTLMPAIDLSQAWVTALKLGNVRDHFTPVINLGTTCNRTEVTVVVDHFDPVNHTTACKLIVGGAAVTPSATTYTDDPSSPGRRTYIYSFTHASTTSLRIELPGTLASILSQHHVESRFFRSWLV
jgi:hypothetical protein